MTVDTGRNRRMAVLLDRHPLWLAAVRQVLAGVGVEVVGEATSPSIALPLIQSRRPHLFLTGIKMADGEMDGIACLQRAREQVPTLRSIVVSSYEDPDHIQQALTAGAAAYVIKTAHPDDLAAAVRQVFEHSIYLADARSKRTHVASETLEESPALTRRELEILEHVAEGLSNAELAKMLWVTEQTIKFHLSNIYRKLNVANRTEASRWAQLRGLLPSEMERGEVLRTSAA